MATSEGVLFATDFSEHSEWVGTVARDVARGRDAMLHIVHVVPPGREPADAGDRLARVASSLAGGARVTAVLLNGRVARQIVEYARTSTVRIIVIGTHGRTGVSRVLLGSVAEAVVRLAPCPVLTVPPPVSATHTEVPESYRCVVCGTAADDLICEGCRSRIRAGVERTLEDERAGGPA